MQESGDQHGTAGASYSRPDAKVARHTPRKSLGQHFLRDRTVPPRIADGACIDPGDLIVEVGPGLGVLTEELARRLDPERGRLLAVELDNDLIPALRERFARMPQVEIVHGDVLQLEPCELAGGRPYKVVANLPYYITSAVLRHFLDARCKPQSMTVMVQREVAERMAAQPPDMSLLAVAVQFYGRPTVLFRVKPGAFNPPPRVESAVVHIALYPYGQRSVEVGDERHFFSIVQAGFGQRRKQLANTLSAGLELPKAEVAGQLRAVGIDPSRRAETLTLHEWECLEKVLP